MGSPARPKRLRSLLARFAANRSGIAAVEFALIAPVMIVFYMGTAQITRMVTVDSKLSSTADTVGDLVTRMKTIDDTAIRNVFAISSAIMNPYKLADLRMVVTAVRVDAEGRGVVHWSRASRGAGLEAGSLYPLPDDLGTYRDTYFVVSTATYQYRPNFAIIGSLGEQTFEHANTFRPRKSLEVTPPDTW